MNLYRIEKDYYTNIKYGAFRIIEDCLKGN